MKVTLNKKDDSGKFVSFTWSEDMEICDYVAAGFYDADEETDTLDRMILTGAHKGNAFPGWNSEVEPRVKYVEIVGLPGGYVKTNDPEELARICAENGLTIAGTIDRETAYKFAPYFVVESNGWDWKIGAPQISGVIGPMKGATQVSGEWVYNVWRYETQAAYNALSA